VGTKGNFTMSGGAVSGNTAKESGGGVVVLTGGNFTMSGGTVSGNTAKKDGGGVFVNGTFTMNDGTVSGNTAKESGGGMYLYKGIFAKTGGTITGYDSDTFNGNAVKDGSGAVKNGSGHVAICITDESEAGRKRKDTTAGPEVNLSTDSAAGWDNIGSDGALSQAEINALLAAINDGCDTEAEVEGFLTAEIQDILARIQAKEQGVNDHEATRK